MMEAMGTCCLVTSEGCGSGPTIFIKLLYLNKRNSHVKENKNDCFPTFSQVLFVGVATDPIPPS